MLSSLFSNSEKEKCFEILELYGLSSNRGWWSKYPKRAVEDITKMDDNTNAMFHPEGNKLIFEETIVTNFGVYYSLSIETDGGHPYVPPEVYVKEPDIDSVPSMHTYGDGRLCLFKPEVYTSAMSILRIRNLASSWCFCHEVFTRTGKWPGAEAKH